MKIALYQGPGHLNNPPAGFSLLAAKAAEAKAKGADLLILPEMFLSGYNIGPAAAQQHAVTLAGLARHCPGVRLPGAGGR
jgi:predicted amidohydrolase